VPFSWFELLNLPAEKMLEPHLFCSESSFEQDDSWIVNPRLVIDTANKNLLRLMYKANVEKHNRSHRITLNTTLTNLMELREVMVISSEDIGISIWNKDAYKIHHGNVRI
jgi:hypothetical protein